jgi:hypothetical protein
MRRQFSRLVAAASFCLLCASLGGVDYLDSLPGCDSHYGRYFTKGRPYGDRDQAELICSGIAI